MYWKVRLERLLVDEGYEIPDEGLPFISNTWRKTYLDVVNALDDMDLMFDGDHFLAELGLYIHAGDPENKPRLLSLSVSRGYEDIVKGILDTYEGNNSGFCYYDINGRDTHFHDPLEDAIFLGSANMVNIFINHPDTIYIDTKLVYYAMTMGRDEIAKILLRHSTLEERIVTLIENSRNGIKTDDLEDQNELMLALFSALFANQIEFAKEITRPIPYLLTVLLEQLVIHGSIEAVEVVLSIVTNSNWVYMSKVLIDNDKLDKLEAFLQYANTNNIDKPHIYKILDKHVLTITAYAVEKGKLEAFELIEHTYVIKEHS
jgi:hypothetical protein